MGQFVAFRIDKKEYYFWDENIKENNWKYAELIDTEYFKKAAEHFNKLFEENKKDNFMLYSLQMQYMHSLESLLALICSIIQAAEFYYGWLLLYKNIQLKKVIKKINSGDLLFNKYKIKNVTWEKIVNRIFRDNESIWTDELKRLLSLIFKKVAHLYIESIDSGCYNSIKHGFRANLNAISKMVIGKGDKKIELKGSEYGFEIGIIKKIEGTDVSYINQKTVNWCPETALKSIEFASIMIHNLKEYIKIINYKGKKAVEMIIPKTEFLEEFISSKDFNIREFITPQNLIPGKNNITDEIMKKLKVTLDEFDRGCGLVNE